jgi:hypothetical protein
MNQALYAHMNNKRKMKKKSKPVWLGVKGREIQNDTGELGKSR